MKKLYLALIIFASLLSNNNLLAQCGITISASTGTTELNCTNRTIKLTAIDTIKAAGGRTYLWSNGGTHKSINVTTAGTYAVTFFYVDKNNDTCSSSSSIIISKDSARPIVTALAIPAAVCAGDSTTLVALGADTYKWMVNGVLISSSAVFKDAPVAPTEYFVTGTGSNGCTAKDSVSVQVLQHPSIVSLNVKKPQCESDSVTLSVSATGDSLRYQWYINTAQNNIYGTPIQGANSATSKVIASADTVFYYCIVTGICDADTSRVSDTVAVDLPVIITAQPSDTSQDVCLNGSAKPLSVVVATNNIQWYENIVADTTTGTPIPGATKHAYTPLTDSAGTKYYYCIASSNCGVNKSDISGPVTVRPLPSASIKSLGDVCRNSISPGILFTGTGGSSPYSFNYKISKVAGVDTVASAMNDSTVLIYPPTDTAGSFTYQLRTVTDAYGCTTIGIKTNAVIIVNPLPVASVKAQVNVCESATPDTVFFKASNGTSPYTFTYNVNASADSTITTIAGEDSAFINVSAQTTGTFNYNLIAVSDSNGCTQQLQKQTAVVNVRPLPAASVSGAGAVCQNTADSIFFSGTNGTAPYAFVYTINGSVNTDTTYSFFNDSAFTVVPTNVAGQLNYKLVSVSDIYGCTTAGSQNDFAAVVINPLPGASIKGPGILCENSTSDTIFFKASGGSGPYTFAYNINGSTDSTIKTIPGNDSAFINVSAQTTGLVNYNLISVSDNNGCTQQLQNQTAVVDVKPLPSATIQGPGNVCESATPDTVFFKASGGTSPYTFVYDINGLTDSATSAPGNSSAFVQAPVNAPGTFNYNLVCVKDSFGCAQQQTGMIILNVNSLPSATIAGTVSVCQSSTPPAIIFEGSNGAQPYTFSYNINGAGTIKTASTGSDSGFVYPSTTSTGSFTYNLIAVSDNNGCTQTQTGNVVVTVSEKPGITGKKISSSCDSTLFKYDIKTADSLTTFAWSRPAVPGEISNAAGSDTTAKIREVLNNITDSLVVVPYYITLSKGPNCVVQDSLLVTVNPTPVIDSIGNFIYCNGQIDLGGIPFSSKSPNASFSWTSNTSVGFGTGPNPTISGFIATNTGTLPLIATDTVRITNGGSLKCKGDSVLFKITVNPSALAPLFSWLDLNNNSLCNGSHNINFNVASPADSTKYLWSAVPPDSNVIIKDTNNANTVISFNAPGSYTFNVVATNQIGGCGDTLIKTINVTNNTGIDERKIILKQPGNLLLYPDNSMDVLKGYQWGYDSIISNSPDHSFGPPTSIEGQVYQFFVPDAKFLNAQNNLDTSKYAFWVLLQKGGCYTKVYYNGPYADNAVQAPPLANITVRLSVLPNPNNGLFEMVLKGNIYGNINAKIYNAMGRLVFTKQLIKTTAELHETIKKMNLPNGLYYIKINSSDMKEAVTRFIIQH